MNPHSKRYDWAVAACERAGLRLTHARQAILRYLAEQSLPLSIEEISQAPAMRGNYDPATVWRTLMRLETLDVVRQVHLQAHICRFVLNDPAGRSDYLVCDQCGSIRDLPTVDWVRHLETVVAATRGFAGVSHELELHGVCPDCQQEEHHA